LIPFIQKLKYKEFEVDFGKRVEEVTAEVEKELPANVAKPDYLQLESSAVYKLADISPRSAVLEAWRSVEVAYTKVARKLSIPDFGKPLSYQAFRSLEKDERIDRNVMSLFRDLRGLRNEAAHAPDFALTKESAIDYANAAQTVANYFNSVAAAFQVTH
jgi:hypothetical protein